ncbi:MAG: acetyl-CoA carboxylase, carboxyltransferase subunit beta [bacterium]|nr:acetyl-CoA carboxylase, carboxyltransferase subunit beta [bacterium]
MVWFKKTRYATITPKDRKDVPSGLWIKCEACNELLYKREWKRNLKVCPKCNYHYKMTARERIDSILDEGSFVKSDFTLKPIDFLKFKDTKTYEERLIEAQKKTELFDAVVTGEGKLLGHPVVLGVMDFAFMGGSMGSVVGEEITRAIEMAIEKRYPLIIISSSGGARMQEGVISLMQMAKTSQAVARLNEEGLLYISVLTNPTTGGVTASFAFLGDIIIAEAHALIGFAGPRVIEQTIRQKLPNGFQRAEFMLEHGLIDMVVNRIELRKRIGEILNFFAK